MTSTVEPERALRCSLRRLDQAERRLERIVVLRSGGHRRDATTMPFGRREQTRRVIVLRSCPVSFTAAYAFA